MSKKMLINASHPEENRVAIVVDGILSELDIEIAGQEQTKGNIYKAVVVRVESGLQAAFVDYGAEKMGFLQIGEIHPSIYPAKFDQDTKSRPRINEILQRGQEILVQIVKEERGTKGAALTTFLSLPGRYMVLMPDSKTKGVSRKIIDEAERRQLKKTMAELDLPERMGYIVRTAGIGKEQEELKRDFDYLVSLYQGIINRKDQVKAPAQLYQESNLVIRSIRDYFSNEIDEVLIDDSRVYQEAKDFFSLVMPDQVGLVKQHRERRPIFSRFQIEEQIDGLARNQIPLPSGGSIVIDQTEALVAIDVNSGKMSSESGIEATAGKTNIEAAAEVGRQLRLRDLGGLIVIDFIDMRDRKRIREVEQTLRDSLRDDKAKVTVGRISQFGLLEMSRQRIKAALSVGAYLDCPHCQGKGRIKSIEAQAVALLRQVHAAASKGQINRIEARTPHDVATYLLNEKRTSLADLEKQLNLSICIEGRPEFIPGQVELELLKREKQRDQELLSVPVSHASQIEEALAAANQEKFEPVKPAAAAETEAAVVETAEAAVAEAAVAETTEESAGRKRRKRRRRRGGRKDAGEQLVAGAADAAAGADSEPPAAAAGVAESEFVKAETTAEDSAAAPAKPRGRRGARKPAVAKSREAVTEVGADEQAGTENRSQANPEQRAAVPSAPEARQFDVAEPREQTEVETKPTRPAARKPAAQKKAAAKPVEETATVSNETAAAAAAGSAEEKPKRRASAKTKTKKVATEPVAAAAAEAATTGDLPGEIGTESKPRRRAPRKSAAKKTAPTQEQPAETAAETPVAPAADLSEVKTGETPQRRTRKKPAATVDDAETPPTGTMERPAEEKPKRRTAKKATAATDAPQPTVPDTAAGATTAAEEKPKRRTPRKTAAKKAEVQAETVAATEEKPKRRAPRKKVAKKAEDSAAAEE